MPFQGEGEAPLETPLGNELDERFYTDLSRLTPANLVTSARSFYVRTGASHKLPAARPWTIALDGLVERPQTLDAAALARSAQPMGLHLMECAGNVRLTHFGLLSAAHWNGVPLAPLVERAAPRSPATQVLVSGFDSYETPSQTSVAGADWVFPLEAFRTSGAFLATAMGGETLSPDHGAPVRLVVPGWYGCACIKWVQRITLVDDTQPSTSQMLEFAVRTLQNGKPERARDFQPATIDHAAMPVRVEHWTVAGETVYRVVGLLWGGGSQAVTRLGIRFRPEDDFVPVNGFRPGPAHLPWKLWTHLWKPATTGFYAIQLAVMEPTVSARKMDMGLYVRFVDLA